MSEPPLIRYQSLRKRAIPSVGLASNPVSASAGHSVVRRSSSASAHQRFSTRGNHGSGRIAESTQTSPLPAPIASTTVSSRGVIDSKPTLTLAQAA